MSINSFGKSLVVTLGLLLACFAGPILTCHAQLAPEMHDLLSEMIPELDRDLQIKFQSAIDRDSSRVVLTPDEFRRFREHPLNPFDGMDGIDPESLGGNIELKFEVPSLRSRQIHELERQYPPFLNSLVGCFDSLNRSVVRVADGEQTLCLGTVVGTGGEILCKASEITDHPDLHVFLSSGQRCTARVVRTDEENDLALITIDDASSTGISAFLQPVILSDRQPVCGEFVITPAANGQPLAMGTYSNPPRAQQCSGQGFLGVQPETVERGVRLLEVTPGGAASIAGLIAGDVVLRIDETRIFDVAQLVAEIGRRKEGDEIELQVLRGNQQMIKRAVLAGRDVSAERASKFRMMNRLGAIPSARASGLPWVFQHDTPLFPEQCGGPIVDLDGNVLGINIAREGRVSSLAIPASHLKKVIPELLRPSVANAR